MTFKSSSRSSFEKNFVDEPEDMGLVTSVVSCVGRRETPILNCTGACMFIQARSFLFPVPLNYCVAAESGEAFRKRAVFETPPPFHIPRRTQR